MKCSECNYCWQDKNDDYERCHYEKLFPEDMAPCEWDEPIDREEEEFEEFEEE